MTKTSYHLADGTEVEEENDDFMETGFTVTETNDRFTAELGQFYSPRGEFTLTATKSSPEFTRELFIAAFTAAVKVIS